MVVHRRRPVLVLAGPRRVAPAAGAAGRREVVAEEAGEALRIRIVEGQGVEREMIRLELEGPLERRHPAVDRRARHVVQEIEAEGRDAGCPGLGDRSRDIGRPMAAPEALQRRVVEGLDAVRQPGDPGRHEGRRVAPVVRAGIRLERDLGVGGETVALVDQGDDLGDRLGRQE